MSGPERDEQGEALEREFADVLGALRGFAPVDAPPGLEERIAVTLKTTTKDAPAQVDGGEAEADLEIRARALRQGVSLRCAFCHDALRRPEASFCASCLAPHHGECFREHGRCSAPGCEETRTVRPGEGARRGSGRTSRPGGARRRGVPLVLVGAAVLAGLLAVGVRVVTAPVGAPARDEVAMFEEYERLDAEAMKAFRRFNLAERAGDLAAAEQSFKEAHAKWTRAIEILDGLLAGHRGPDGFTSAEYEGYEEELSRVAQHLVDLEKRGTLGATAPRPTGVHDAARWMARARERMATGQLEAARADVIRALDLDPQAEEAWALLAELDAAAGRSLSGSDLERARLLVVQADEAVRAGRTDELLRLIQQMEALLEQARRTPGEAAREVVAELEPRLETLREVREPRRPRHER